MFRFKAQFALHLPGGGNCVHAGGKDFDESKGPNVKKQECETDEQELCEDMGAA